MYTTPEEVIDYSYDLLDSNSGTLGIEYIAYGHERIIPAYPAVQLLDCAIQREIVGTHKFGIVFILEMFVLHANMNESYKQRTKSDMELATAVKDLFDAHGDFEENIIFGFIDSSSPGVLSRRMGDKAHAVVSTRMTWRGESRQNF